MMLQIEQEEDPALVSIILPVFNGEKFLAQAVESCISQTYDKWELIVVDDCSTDNSFEIAYESSKKDERIRIISNEKNRKLPASLNVGHREAKGEIMTWISDDNFFEPNAIQVMVEKLLDTGVDIVYSNFNIVEEDSSLRRAFIIEENSSLLLGNIIGASFLYKREVFERNKGYDENLHMVEDYDFWLQASLHSLFHHEHCILYNYRSHRGSMSSGLAEKDSELETRFSSKLKTSYLKFFRAVQLEKAENYAELFAALHQYKEISVVSLLSKYKDFREDMDVICQKIPVLDKNSLLINFDLRIRSIIQHYGSNQNFPTLYTVLKYRPEILLRYDRRNSLRMIINSLKPQ